MKMNTLKEKTICIGVKRNFFLINYNWKKTQFERWSKTISELMNEWVEAFNREWIKIINDWMCKKKKILIQGLVVNDK
jgi:hypothetical protein